MRTPLSASGSAAAGKSPRAGEGSGPIASQGTQGRTQAPSSLSARALTMRGLIGFSAHVQTNSIRPLESVHGPEQVVGRRTSCRRGIGRGRSGSERSDCSR